jgi:ferrous iron transport protein A
MKLKLGTANFNDLNDKTNRSGEYTGDLTRMSENLTNLQPGERGRVSAIDAGKYATKRLYEIGFNTSAHVTVIKNDIGPVIVSINGNKVALGRGLASKVVLSKEC